jgi:hypothetical protein
LLVGLNNTVVRQWHRQQDSGQPVVSQWPVTDGPSVDHQWSATIDPPADQQWHLLPTADRRKTDEQNSGGSLVAAAGGPPRAYVCWFYGAMGMAYIFVPQSLVLNSQVRNENTTYKIALQYL